jgi:hypothetical protein
MTPRNGPTPESSRGPDCILVSPLAESAAWEREIHAWCFFADPTLLSLPNDQHGFGIVRRDERVLPLSDIPIYQCKIELRQSDPFPDLALSAPVPSMERQVAESWVTPSPPPPTLPPTTALPRGVVWYLASTGEVLAAPPGVPPAELQKALAENPTLVGPTMVEVDRTLSPTRLRLVQKCGGDALDHLALRALRKRLLKLETQVGPVRPWPAGAGIPEKGQAWTVAVEWRLTAPPPAAASTGADSAAKPATPARD